MIKTPRPIRLTDTKTGKKELLQTREAGKLSYYSCGPTVYGLIHVGNLRSGLVSDLFFKYFQRSGYDVTFVRNYTDVDDKIINRAVEEGMDPAALAKKYTLEVEKDYAAAGMAEPTRKVTVTDHIQEIIRLIERILKNGHAYVLDTGDVLFSIQSFPSYGALSGKKLEDLESGARVEVNLKKKNPMDFSLWKPAKPGEPSWPSPWGAGRPGWHIECSAMASRWLGDQMDVHHGGADLIFPHHENEVAQSEAASHQAPFVKVWLHHAFVTMSQEKMSKSLGNVFLAREFLTQFSGEFARYFLLGVHYRSPIDFTQDNLSHALQGLQRLYEAKAAAQKLLTLGRARADMRAESAWGEFVAQAEATKKEIDEHLANDLNTPGALGSLFSLVREFNKTLSEPLAAATPSAVLGAEALIAVIEQDIGGVLGVGRLAPEAALDDLQRIREHLARSSGAAGAGTRVPEAEILAAIVDRKAARAAKDFARADQIRKDLEARGVLLKDGPQGTTWSYS